MSQFRRGLLVGAAVLGVVLWWKEPAIRHRWLVFTAPAPEPAGLVRDENYLSVLFVGQSNAANHGDGRSQIDGSHRAWYAGQSYRLHDPLPGCTGVGGSVGVLLARATPPTGSAWLIACAAKGSTNIADWQPGGEAFSAARRTVAELIAQGLGPHWIVVHQGETDAWRQTDPSRYEADLRALIDNLAILAPNARFLLCQTTIWSNSSGAHPGLREAQERIWVSLPHVWAGVDTDSFPSDMRAADGVHFNERGLVSFANLLRKAMAAPSDVPRRHSS